MERDERMMVMKIIEVNNLSFSYGGDKEILKDINFSVEAGEIFGFLGPNGSGKSTTQKVLTGILEGYSGEVSVLGKNLKDWNYEIYNELNVLFEYPYLYSNLSAIDNLKYFSSFYPKSMIRNIDELLDELDLKSDFRQKTVSKYSKGMKQRTNMARVLVSSPKLLFLDEPTSGLDPVGSVLFRDIIKREKEKGTTVFLTTHNMHDAELLCDRVAFIVEGEIVAIDTPENFVTKSGEQTAQVTYRRGELVEAVEVPLNDIDLVGIEYDEIVSIVTKERNLEEIFLQMTGRELR